MKYEEYDVPDDLLYHKEHQWVKKMGDIYVFGITDFAQKLAGDITYVDIPMEGDRILKDKAIGTMESGKWVGKIFAPFDAEVVEVNEDVIDDATIINQSPYGDGWLMKLKPLNPSQISELLDAMKYIEIMKKKLEEIDK